MAEESTTPRKAPTKKTRGRRGDGSLFKDARSGLWTVAIELPPVKWKANGEPFRNRKSVQFSRRSDAAAALRDLRDQRRRVGTLPTNSQTVRQWFDKWMRVHVIPEQRPRTADTYRTYVDTYIVPALGASTRIAKLTPDDIRKIETYVMQLGLSASTAKKAFHYASSALDVALKDGLLLANPASRVSAPRSARPVLDVLTLDEAVTLIQHLATHPDRALWMSYILTAGRRGEIAGLEVNRTGETLDLTWQLQRLVYTHGCGDKLQDQYPCGTPRGGNCPKRALLLPNDYEARQISGGLHLTRPKSQAGWRIIPLVEPLRSILMTHIAGMAENPWGLLFAGTHGRYGGVTPPDPDKITHAWPTLRDEVFGPGRTVRLHDLRHSTVDLLYLAGVPEDLIQEIVGHSTRAQLRQYKSRSDIARLRSAMESLSELVGTPAVRPLTLPAKETKP